MNPKVLKPIFAAVVLAAGWAVAGAVGAQYVWVDGNGVKQYSDMPPPASVPAANILKTPRSPAGTQAAAAPAAETGDGADSGKPKAPPSIADKNAEFTKRRTEQAEREKKAAEQSRIAAEKARNCERARQYQKTLASGVRMASTDKNGERVFLDDAQRAQEEREVRNVLKECSDAG